MRILSVFVLLALLCTVSFAAPPADPVVKVSSDAKVEYADPGVNQWFDLLIQVDPKGAAIAADGLKVLVAAGLGVEIKDPIYPPAPEGGFVKPFAVRVPAVLTTAHAAEFEVTVTGKRSDGAAFSVKATGEARANGHISSHLTGKATLKQPAVAGEPNAVVLDLGIMAPYHVYGTAGKDEGVPVVAYLVPGVGAKPEVYWTDGGRTNPADKKYEGVVRIEIPFTPVKAGKLDLRAFVSWQACTDQLCDAQEIAYFPLTIEVKGEDVAIEVPTGTGDAQAEVTGSGADKEDDLKNASLWKIALLSIGAGFIALVMPCTYPLIPITISFFTKQAEERNGKVLSLALAYGAGIIAVFVIAGVVVGEPILVFAARWWVNLIFALMFLYFGLSLIGLFDIRLPAFFNNLAAKTSGTGGYMSVFAMGTTLVITSFTCTAPFVGALLVFAATGGSVWTVAFAMAVFGLTMAIPFVFLSLSPNGLKAMPKSGMWMKTLKVTLGIIELGLVLKFVSNIDVAFNIPPYIGREVFLVLWGASFLAAALYLFDVVGLVKRSARWALSRGRAVFSGLLFFLTVYLMSGVDGTPLVGVVEAFMPPNPRYGDGFLAVAHEDFDEGLALAKEKHAPIFLHFTGFV